VIDLQLLREHPDLLRASRRARGQDESLVDELLAADEQRRATGVRFDNLRAEQKALGRQIAAASGEARSALLERASGLAGEVKAAEATRVEAEAESQRLMLALDNLIEDDVPVGGEDDFVVLEEIGTPRQFDFSPRDHVELGQMLGAIDMERGAKVSGARFYYLTGSGALLELALINLAMAQAVEAGFTPVIAPALVKPRAMEGTGFLGQAAENVFHLERDDFYLVGTAEAPLAAYHMDEILDVEQLPLRYAGFSPCYRREAGAYGKDTRGIIRVHWFDKVEMFSLVAPEEAQREHQRLLAWQKEFLAKLEVAFRVVDIASGDLGAAAVRKFDCEAWIPSQGKYRELTSTSNCTEFQSRRLSIRMRDETGVRPLATLNGTLCAMTRAIVAILENHQQADGSVTIPAALRPYLGGRETLEPVAKP